MKCLAYLLIQQRSKNCRSIEFESKIIILSWWLKYTYLNTTKAFEALEEIHVWNSIHSKNSSCLDLIFACIHEQYNLSFILKEMIQWNASVAVEVCGIGTKRITLGNNMRNGLANVNEKTTTFRKQNYYFFLSNFKVDFNLDLLLVFDFYPCTWLS